jgi:hypothetical protein
MPAKVARAAAVRSIVSATPRLLIVYSQVIVPAAGREAAGEEYHTRVMWWRGLSAAAETAGESAVEESCRLSDPRLWKILPLADQGDVEAALTATLVEILGDLALKESTGREVDYALRQGCSPLLIVPFRAMRLLGVREAMEEMAKLIGSLFPPERLEGRGGTGAMEWEAASASWREQPL